VSSSDQFQRLELEVSHYRNRVGLLRARLSRQDMGSSARLRALERILERAERRLHEARAAASP
jgi:hypothetical protein